MISLGLGSSLRFYFGRWWRSHPALVSITAASLLGALLAAVALWHAHDKALAAMAGLAHARRAELRAPALPPKAVESGPAVPSLPWFQSAQLIEQIGNAAADSGLGLDEVGYVLEDGPNRPYLRYRVTMTVAASYPAIRRFASNVTTTLSHVDLDSINCTRSDILVAPLTCELAFSAFFRADTHG